MCFPLFLSLWFVEHTSDLFCNTRWPLWNDATPVLVPVATARPAPACRDSRGWGHQSPTAGGELEDHHFGVICNLAFPACGSLLLREH